MSASEREGLLHDTGATSTSSNTWTTKCKRGVIALGACVALVCSVASIGRGDQARRSDAALGASAPYGALAASDLGVGMQSVKSVTSARGTLGQTFEVAAAERLLPVFFHTEKSGGTSLVLHALELLAEDRPDVLALLNRVRNEDVMLDEDLRAMDALCPGSAMFLTTVWQAGSKWEAGVPRPLEDYSDEHWSKCSLLTSHTGRELLRRAEEIEKSSGVRRPKLLMGMFRDPVEYEQAAWRSELFMYHDLRSELGWGKLADTPLGSAIPDDDLKDFTANSKFADIMINHHCAKHLDTNFQTKKVIEEEWWSLSSNLPAALAEAKKRVRELAWIGLTNRFDESACMLSYMLRKKPKPTSESNYDRAKLLPETLSANHPHSGQANEGFIDEELKQKLYACNDMDNQLFHLAQQEFQTRVKNARDELQRLVNSGGSLSPIKIVGPQWLHPQEYLDCLN